MPFYETMYEDGSTAVGFCDTDEIFLRGAQEHQRRAESGQKSRPVAPGENPAAVPVASRIKAVEVYDKHPGDRGPLEHEVTLEEFQEAVALAQERGTAAAEGDGTVKVNEAAAALLEATDVHTAVDEREPFASRYKTKATKKLKPTQWATSKSTGGEV
jgi:hypothetical protein